ncbi:MAG: glycosyltransferase family 2 protein [Rhodospirillaceae bacterium]|nr:glycosyltransferase family 2 protein [Rhodospirillaceae bacterium]
MTDTPLISIVIPCYNSGRTLPQTLASVRAQTHQPLEVIVVDDGSTDPETVALLDSLTDIKLVRQANQGLPAARNTGFRNATGTYVLPLDSDDWLDPTAIEKLLAALRSNPSADFAFSYIQMEGECCGTLAKNFNFFEQLFVNQLPYCLLLPRALWLAVGGYDETMRRGYEDWEFNIRLGGHRNFGVVVHEPLFHYRVSSGGMLLATSSHLHGQLWRNIQARNPALYSWNALWSSWKVWRKSPSTYPLWIYFIWLFLHHKLPHTLFQRLFRFLLQHSHGRRVTHASRVQAPT